MAAGFAALAQTTASRTEGTRYDVTVASFIIATGTCLTIVGYTIT